MTTKADLKKLFVYSSHEKKMVLESIMGDMSLIAGKSNSSTIEESLASNLLGSDPTRASLIYNLYSENNISTAIKLTFQDIFTYIECNDAIRLDSSRTKVIVEASFEDLTKRNNNIMFNDDDSNRFNHLLYYLHFISDVIRKSSIQLEKYDSNIAPYLNSIDEWKDRDPESIFYFKDSFLSIYILLLRTWGVISSHPYTFRLLAAMTYFQVYSDSAEARYNLMNIIKNW